MEAIETTQPEAVASKPRRERGTGRIWQIGRIWWIQYYAGSRQIRESSRSTTKTVAERLLRRRLGEAEAGLVPSPSVQRLRYEEMRKALFAEYATNHRKSLHSRKDGTLLICGVPELDEFFRDCRAIDIETTRIREFIRKRQEKGAPNSTINRSLAALRRMFHLAKQDGKLRDVPHIPMLKEPPPRKGFLEYDQYARLRDALPDYLKPITTMGFYTGMRLGELRSLRWEQVNFANKEVQLDPGQTKNDEPRVIPLNDLPELLHMLRMASDARRPGYDFVFFRDGGPLGNFYKAWTRTCVRIGLGRMVCKNCSVTVEGKPYCAECKKAGHPSQLKYCGLVFHDLRRTGIRNLIRAGVPERVAMQISGHKTRAVFERYNITSKRDLQDAARKLGAYLETQNGENSRQIETNSESYAPGQGQLVN